MPKRSASAQIAIDDDFLEGLLTRVPGERGKRQKAVQPLDFTRLGHRQLTRLMRDEDQPITASKKALRFCNRFSKLSWERQQQELKNAGIFIFDSKPMVPAQEPNVAEAASVVVAPRDPAGPDPRRRWRADALARVFENIAHHLTVNEDNAEMTEHVEDGASASAYSEEDPIDWGDSADDGSESDREGRSEGHAIGPWPAAKRPRVAQRGYRGPIWQNQKQLP